MELNEYQDKAKQTALFPEEYGIIYTTLGLVGESGEVAEKVKKYLRDKTSPADLKADVAKELGDVLWYLAMLAKECGYTLEDIAAINVEKLQSRQKRGKIGGSGDDR
jgi:NTP pyrophosphatase (non-canonical NTP hydrolase)